MDEVTLTNLQVMAPPDDVRVGQHERIVAYANSVLGVGAWGWRLAGPITWDNGIYVCTIEVTIAACPPSSGVGMAVLGEDRAAIATAAAYSVAIDRALVAALAQYGSAFRAIPREPAARKVTATLVEQPVIVPAPIEPPAPPDPETPDPPAQDDQPPFASTEEMRLEAQVQHIRQVLTNPQEVVNYYTAEYEQYAKDSRERTRLHNVAGARLRELRGQAVDWSTVDP